MILPKTKLDGKTLFAIPEPIVGPNPLSSPSSFSSSSSSTNGSTSGGPDDDDIVEDDDTGTVVLNG